MRLLAEDLLLLGGGLLGGLLCCLLRSWLLGLLGLGLLGCRLLGGQLEASCSLLASGGGGVHLVVGHDVLEDGLAGGSLLVLQPLDGSGDHAGVGGVGSGLGGLLGLGGLGSGGHGFDLLAGSA